MLSHVEDENENSASVDNEDNNNNDEINGVVAPIIQTVHPTLQLREDHHQNLFRLLMTVVMEMQATLDV